MPESLAVMVHTTIFPVMWSVVGSALFVAVLSLYGRVRYPVADRIRRRSSLRFTD